MKVKVLLCWGICLGRRGTCRHHQQGQSLRARGVKLGFFAILDVEGGDVPDAVKQSRIVVGGRHGLVCLSCCKVKLKARND